MITVSDTGNGIAPEHLPHVFEPFYRADRAREVSEHLGLGLYLVQTHARALRGTCTVTSTVGRGTTFTLRVPGMCKDQSRPERDSEPSEPAAQLAKPFTTDGR